MQVLSAEIGFERGGASGGDDGKAADAAENVAQGQATKATSIGEAIKDFLTTPQVSLPVTYIWLTLTDLLHGRAYMEAACMHVHMRDMSPLASHLIVLRSLSWHSMFSSVPVLT